MTFVFMAYGGEEAGFYWGFLFFVFVNGVWDGPGGTAIAVANEDPDARDLAIVRMVLMGCASGGKRLQLCQAG